MLRKHVLMGPIVSSLALTLALVGCGGSAGGDASGDAGTTEAAVEEETGLTNEDVAGYYVSDDHIENVDKGIFTAYRLKKSGTFEMIMYAYDAPLIRKGTYEMIDSVAHVNVPEGESFELQGTTFTAHAIEDAQITFEDDTATIQGIGNQGDIIARKISKKEFEDLVARSAAAGPTEVAVGETVTGDGYTFTVDSFEYRDEIYPWDTSGYYNYYSDQEGQTYLVCEVTYVNTTTSYVVPGYSTGAIMNVGENKYQAFVETDGGGDISKTYRTEAKDTSRLLIYACVPDAAKEEGGQLKLTWVFPKDPSLLDAYFSNDVEHVIYTVTI